MAYQFDFVPVLAARRGAYLDAQLDAQRILNAMWTLRQYVRWHGIASRGRVL